MAALDTNGFSNGSRVVFLSGQTTAAFVLFISASTSAISNAFERAVDAGRAVLRSMREFVEELDLPRISMWRLPPPAAILSRVMLRPVAPVLAYEPEFVGAGLAFRRWR